MTSAATEEQVFRHHPFVVVARPKRILMHHVKVERKDNGQLFGHGFLIFDIDITRRLGVKLDHKDKWDVFPADRPTIVAVNYYASNDERDLASNRQGMLTLIGDTIEAFNIELARQQCEGKEFIFSIPFDQNGSFDHPDTGLRERLHVSRFWSLSELAWAEGLLKDSDGVEGQAWIPAAD